MTYKFLFVLMSKFKSPSDLKFTWKLINSSELQPLVANCLDCLVRGFLTCSKHYGWSFDRKLGSELRFLYFVFLRTVFFKFQDSSVGPDRCHQQRPLRELQMQVGRVASTNIMANLGLEAVVVVAQWLSIVLPFSRSQVLDPCVARIFLLCAWLYLGYSY